MSCRIVQHKQRLEVLQRTLGGCALHLLRLVHDDNGTVGCNNIDRTATLEIVTTRIDDTCCSITLPAFHVFRLIKRRVESLRIDNHHTDICTTRKIINSIQVAAIIYKRYSLFAIMLINLGSYLQSSWVKECPGVQPRQLCIM